MSALTNMTVLSVADPLMVGAVLRESMSLAGPAYIRMGVGKSDPVIYDPDTLDIRIGRGIVAREGCDVTIVTHGTTLGQSLAAAAQLAREGIEVRVVDMFTIKPLDEELLARCAAETGGILAVEDHLLQGGLASRAADFFMDSGIRPRGFRRLGIPPVFPGFGPDAELREKHGYGLSQTIAAARTLAEEGRVR